jgi:hypothetical protein
MKKILLSLGVVMTSISLNAQVDTLSSHASSPQTNYTSAGLDAVAPIDSGYVGGNNVYGDVAKMQLFDATYGVTGAGTINKVAFFAPIKTDGGGSFAVAIWSDNAGTPNAVPIATATVTLAALDTAVAAWNLIGDGNIYNHVATFSTPVAIPAGNKFWAGIVLPTGATNSMALICSQNFAAAATHTGEFWNDATFHTFGAANNWNFQASLAIFPIVNFTAGLNEEVENSLSVYPNPANDVLNVSINGTIETVSIISMDGKVVSSTLVNNASTAVNVADLKAGVYFYEVKTSKGATVRNTFVKQ